MPRVMLVSLAVAALVAGCAHVGIEVASPVSTPSAAETPGPTLTLGPTHSASTTQPSIASEAPTLRADSQPTNSAAIASPSANATVIPSSSSVVGLERSDRFWARWVETRCFFGLEPLPSSVVEIFAKADLVVRGRIVDLYVGERWRMNAGQAAEPLAYLRVQIDELLKGQPKSRQAGYVEVQIGHAPSDMDRLRAQLPADDHLLFLDYEDPATREWFNQSDIVGFVYYMGQDVERVFRDIDGTVQVLAPEAVERVYGADEFLLRIDGTSFDDLLERVRELAAANGRDSVGQGRAVREPHALVGPSQAC